MLVVETNGDSPVRRVTAADVKQKMVTFYNRSGSNAAYLSGQNPLNASPTTWIPHHSRIGNFLGQEISRQSSSVTEPADYDGYVLDLAPAQGGSWELAWALQEIETRTTYLSSGGTSDCNEGSTSLNDIHSSETSTFSSDLSGRQVSTTQTTRDTNLGQLGHVRSFACPFFKHNAGRYGKTCSHGRMYIHRLKYVLWYPQCQYNKPLTTYCREHLYRRHLLPKQRCTRCLAYFEDSAGLKAHTRSVMP